jgi:hypothetical protein
VHTQITFDPTTLVEIKVAPTLLAICAAEHISDLSQNVFDSGDTTEEIRLV